MGREDFNVDKFIEHKATFDEATVSNGMAENANILGYYGYQEAEWSYAIENLKLQIDTRSAEIDIELRESGDKVTENSIKASVAAHEEIKRLKQGLSKAKQQQALYRNAVSTIEQRGKMLVSYNANRRNEKQQYGISDEYFTTWGPKATSGGFATGGGVGSAYYHGATSRTSDAKLSDDAKKSLLEELQRRSGLGTDTKLSG